MQQGKGLHCLMEHDMERVMLSLHLQTAVVVLRVLLRSMGSSRGSAVDRDNEKKPRDRGRNLDPYCKGFRNRKSECKLWKKLSGGKDEKRNQSCRTDGWH